MKKTVLHCLGQLNVGGAETLVMNIYRNIDRSMYQFNFLVFSPEKGYFDDEVESLGSSIFYQPSISAVGLRKYIINLINFFKQNPHDIVHIHMDWIGGFIALAAHKAGVKKIIVHSHANQDIFGVGIAHKIKLAVSRILIHRYVSVMLSCSDEAGKSLFRYGYQVFYNGIDMKKYVNVPKDNILKIRQELGINDNEVVVGSVGSLSSNKNHSFLIDVFYNYLQNNDDAKLIIVGKGPLENNLKDKCKELNISNKVIFTGIRDDVNVIMHIFDVFMLPSISEGLGIVAIEAQACGVPCVVSQGVPKLIDLKNSPVCFEEFNVKKWVNLIKKNNINFKTEELLSSKYNICNSIEYLYQIYGN